MKSLRAIALTSVLISATLFSGSSLCSSLIKCVHSDGSTEFTDKPCPSTSSSSTVSLLPALGRSQENTRQIASKNNEIVSNRNSPITSTLPVASTQAISVVTAWHQALVKNDFVAFKELQLWIGRGRDALESEKELKRTFDTLVKNAPAILKLSEYKPPTSRTVFLDAIGCKNNVRVGGPIDVHQIDGRWKVESNGWVAGWIEEEPANLPCAYEAGSSLKKTKLENKSEKIINGLIAEDRLKSCDPDIAIAAAQEIVGNPANLKEPLQLFSPAFAFFQNGRKDEGVFWFYAAQLRTKQQMILENGDRGQLLAVMQMSMGGPINNYAFQNTSNLNQILNRVLEWDKKTPNPFREQARSQKLDKQMEQIYAGFGDLKKKLVTEKNSMEAAARQAAPEIEKMYIQANNQRCPKGQQDPMYRDQTIKSEESLAIDFVKTNQKVIQEAGENLRVYPSMRTTSSNNSLPSRYSLFVKGKNGLATAVVDINRAGGKAQFSLACITDERSAECPK